MTAAVASLPGPRSGAASQGATASRADALSKRAWKRGEATASRCEIFEQENEEITLGACVKATGHEQVEACSYVRVELHLADPHANGADHLPVAFVERRQLHEQRCGARARLVVGEANARSLVRREGVIEHLYRGDGCAEHLSEPVRREIGGLAGQGGRDAVLIPKRSV